MKASYSWLRELVGPTFKLTPVEVSERLTAAGLEVESQSEFGAASDHVVIARVLEKFPHPERPKLNLVKVDAGNGEVAIVVCGAGNVPEPGGRVVLAKNGTYLPALNVTLAPKDFGSIVSSGMLCSESELGLRAASSGLFLPDRGEPGEALAAAMPETRDTIFEIGLTPNRPDCLGHVGLARELAALTGASWTSPFSEEMPAPSSPITPEVSVALSDVERCPSYAIASFVGVRVGPSPLKVALRLESLGVRSISNVVDITNWVLMLFGHPIHSFDRARLRGGEIQIRRASSGEPFVALDGVKRSLTDDDLVIADREGPIALAGVMGGEGSGIQADSTEVVIECAYFQPRGVRRSSRRHGLHTESSHRFERGIDPGDFRAVLVETARLLSEWAGGALVSPIRVAGPGVARARPIPLEAAQIERIIGTALPLEEAREILVRLGCEPTGAGFLPPTHRPDLTLTEDLVEEVIRVRGLEHVRAVLPPIRPGEPRHFRVVERRIIDEAVRVGLSEALTFGFTSPSWLDKVCAPPATLKLKNPLTDDRAVMRTSLLPGLFEALLRAERFGVENVRVFATGARFLEGDGPLPKESRAFSAVISGFRDAVLERLVPIDAFDVKGVALSILKGATGEQPTLTIGQGSDLFHPRAHATLAVGGVTVGEFGLVHPRLLRSLGLTSDVGIITFELEPLEERGVKLPRFSPIPGLPASNRDLAVVVHDDILAETVSQAIVESAGELAESVELFDLFRGGNLPADHRSLGFRITYRDPKARTAPDHARTLTDQEVDERHQAVVKELARRFGAELRA